MVGNHDGHSKDDDVDGVTVQPFPPDLLIGQRAHVEALGQPEVLDLQGRPPQQRVVDGLQHAVGAHP
eukprot:403642-Pyramimonas_sp.AAC.1